MDEIAALLEPHIPALRRYAWALLRDGDAADDLVQDCLERALARWRLRRRDGNLRAWLFTIQRNLFLSGLRRGRRRGPDVDINALAAVPSAEASQDSELMRRDVLAELDALSEEQRSVLLLVAVEDFSYAETARILGVPLGTVMSRLSRARGDAPASGLRLRRGLEEGQQPVDEVLNWSSTHNMSGPNLRRA